MVFSARSCMRRSSVIISMLSAAHTGSAPFSPAPAWPCISRRRPALS